MYYQDFYISFDSSFLMEYNSYLCAMKKAVHYILSYLGALLFFSGIIGTVLKWITISVFMDYMLEKKIIIAFIAIFLGIIFTLHFYKPLKYQ
jgi:flagellar motor component MotA